MSIIAACPSASCARPTDDLPRRVSESVFEFFVDRRVIETTAAVGTVIAEVVFIAEFVVGDAVFEVALLAERG